MFSLQDSFPFFFFQFDDQNVLINGMYKSNTHHHNINNNIITLIIIYNMLHSNNTQNKHSKIYFLSLPMMLLYVFKNYGHGHGLCQSVHYYRQCCEGENSAWKVMLYKLCLYYEYVKFMLVMRYSSEISSMLKTRNKECNHTDTTHKGKGEFAKIQNIQVSVTQEYRFSRLRISCKYPCLGIDLFRTFNSPL